MSQPSIELHAALFGTTRIDFDRRSIRKALRGGAQLVRREARKILSKRSGSGRIYRVWGDVIHRASAAGEAPAKLTGLLQRSIQYRTRGSGGFAMAVGPSYAVGFYGRFLAFGTKTMAPRAFMVPALEIHRAAITAMLNTALADSLVPR
jgi:HK97 gp10 family phage protein